MYPAAMGWGKGKGPHAAVVAAEAALVGGAIVGTAAAPRRDGLSAPSKHYTRNP